MIDAVDNAQDFLEQTYFNNTVLDYIIAVSIILLGLLLIRLFKSIVLTRLKKWTDHTDTNLDNYVVESIDRFVLPVLYFSVIYFGISYLNLSAKFQRILEVATTVVITFLVIRFVSTVALFVLRSIVKRQTNGEEKVKQLGGLMLIINIIIWFIGLIFLFDNMGYDVTTVIAGLGIGGIAIALAAQNILGDLFNYFVIFLDRPFEIGDFVIIDDKMGVIDYIGIKTTRIKSLSGEQLVFSNSDLTTSRIHNYKRMQRRRVLFRVGVIYQTTHEQLKQIPATLKSIVLEQDPVEFDRAHFASYGDSSLDFEIVYYVLSSDYNVYMDVQQGINMRIFEEFQRMGIEFAYPTRTLFVMNENGEEAKLPLQP
ncbi:mechanosensitive ion channel family protein [Pontibacter harenae]|uniref:mechanosensitive ion channel family protein n=1 Tax=Pontibacter harenae TaxID=2894083 RepID=UPI001E5D1B95|nr:mechanosensitive ion channel family protein [Pontibacter harenae]MCC9167021.1 mechanosensitive ion channel family protein [Pontibacter harenae]